ncbi:MAG: helix-turn-helix transcriptional regulator [Caulobacteraceae bacterium]|nr:helix-turn-helix transcriptional regulator [Caulobacteraceae bacterium]
MTQAGGQDPNKRRSALVDQSVGARIRALRRERKLTQADFARALGVTFQQIQKYELGRNRVSASRLYDMAFVLNVPLAVFFEDLPAPNVVPPDRGRSIALTRFLRTPYAEALVGGFLDLTSDRLRALVVELACALAAKGSDAGLNPGPAGPAGAAAVVRPDPPTANAPAEPHAAAGR